MDDCGHLSALGDDPDAWIDLDDDELKQVLSVKFIEYGATQDGSRIAGLFALYRHAIARLDVAERREMLTEFSEMIEQHEGLGHMGLMMSLAADIPRPQDQVAAQRAEAFVYLSDPRRSHNYTSGSLVLAF
jgi:hypothetical protein